MPEINKWNVTTDPKSLRRLGKLIEELGELSNVAGRCIIQGIDETDPGSKKKNRLRLEEEIADVEAQISLIENHFNLDKNFIDVRFKKKISKMKEWESYFVDEECK